MIYNVKSSALQILQQATPVRDASGDRSTADLVAIANNTNSRIVGTTQPTQSASKVAETMFGLNSTNINQLRLDIIERTGNALGVDQDDFVSMDEFVGAMQEALGKLKMEGGNAAVLGLEKELELDIIGVSVQDVIDSARDPEANGKLTKALEKQLGRDEVGKAILEAKSSISVDEIGLYSPF